MNIHSVLEQIEANQRRVRMFLRTKKDGTTFLVPFYKRGNDEYAYKYGKLFLIYKQKFLQGLADNSVMFITLATPYPSTYNGCHDSWKVISKAIKPFTTTLKIKAQKKLGAIKYMAVKEATSEGLCHCHLLVIWNRPVKVSIRNGKYYLEEKELSKYIREKWDKQLMKFSELKPKNNSVSVRVCPNKTEAEKVFDYVTKHLGERSDITNALERVQENKETRNDKEKLLSNYWGFTLGKIRLYSFSRNF
jgi:hypothetical protein